MATAPSTTDQSLKSDAQAVLSFGLSHLILIVLLALSLVGSVYLYDSKRADAADLRASMAQQTNAQVQSSTAAQINQLQAEISSLTKSIATRDTQLTKQQVVDTTLPLTDLATRWQSLVKVQDPLQVGTDSITLSKPDAVATTQALESIPVLTQNLADETKAAADAEAQYKAEVAAHTSDVTACKAQVSALKASARRSKLRWFAAGFITGVTLGLIH